MKNPRWLLLSLPLVPLSSFLPFRTLTAQAAPQLDDHIPEGAAGRGRWRTTPLWGLRARKFFLHDGRASDLVTAIRMHAGEASRVRDRFLTLLPSQRADLIALLQSL